MKKLNVLSKLCGLVLLTLWMFTVATGSSEGPERLMVATISMAAAAIILAMPVPPDKGDK